MAVPKQPHIFSDEHLEEFLAESQTCTDVLDCMVTTQRKRTEVTLSRPGLSPDYVTQMVQALLKAAKSTRTAGVIDLLSLLVGSRFFMHEIVSASSASDKNTDENFSFIEISVELLNQVSMRIPSSFTNAFGLIIILQKRTEDILLTAEGERRKCVATLSERLAEMRDNVMKKMVSRDNPRLPFEKQTPPDDFRNIPILPRLSDIFLGSRGTFLRKNKSRGSYDNLHHYLDVQFRLYREDCISPLREGITQYIQEINAGQSVRRLQDGRLYKNVSVEYVERSVEGQMYKVTLDPQHAKKIKWKSSRRLLYGSLLCLSADNFYTMVFAIVEESDRDTLAKDHCFKIVFPIEVGEVRLPLNVSFTMVESTAYFEAYRHVLAGLQRLEDGELPFEKYIVDCQKNVDLPLYLSDANSTYDLRPIVSGNVIFSSLSQRPLRVVLNDPVSHWPSAEELHLDQSQFEAYYAALTQEFVLIQGPPGTGKTHVGLQIAKTLLHNKEAWQNKPSRQHQKFTINQPTSKDQILIVCYTNHALDQFLEGIVKFLDDRCEEEWSDEIVRVGGRCENEAIQKFSLRNRRYNHHRSLEQKRKLDHLYKSVELQHQRISFLVCSLSHVHDTVLDVELLKPVMREDHQNFFVEKKQLSSKKLFHWLAADEDAWFQRAEKAYQKISNLQNVSKSNNTEEIHIFATVDNIEDSEAKKVEDDRRIEEDNFKQDFKEQVGLDIRQQLIEVIGIIESQQLLDKTFQSLVQREANATLARLKASGRMDAKEASNTPGNLNKLSMEHRWRLYRHWVHLYQEMQNGQLPVLRKEYGQIIKVYEKEKKEIDAEILKVSTLIGMTTTGAAKYQDVLKEIGPKIVIVEEAAEVLEAHIVTALSPRCEHLILIGDHKQLEPKPSVMQLALQYNLSLSMFERMLNNGIKNHCLQRQHRMRPEISTLVRDIYHVLDDNENVFEYEHIMGVKKDVFFINHNKPEDYADDIKSYSNIHEAKFIANLCKYLMQQGYESTQITVLGAYTGQMFCIRDCMPRHEFEGVKTVAIDNFQGEENDIILLSLVRSNKEGKIGFLSRENRICVALSRAKKGLYVIGNFDLLASRKSRWGDVIKKVKTAGQFGKAIPLYCQNHPENEGLQVEEASEFRKLPEGGCELKCDSRLCCGHVCRLYCHPRDRTHKLYVCKQLCDKVCQNDHTCKRQCHFDENCDCPVVMHKDLPCGHKADMKCCQPAGNFNCEVQVNRQLDCGHSVQLKCHINTKTYKCKLIVTRTLKSCSHQADMQCWKNPDTYRCRTVVKRTPQSCEHEADVECYFDMELHKCKVIVNRILPVCGHEADMECYRKPEDFRCGKTITKTHDNCGHSYDVICSRWNTFYDRMHLCSESVTKSWACPHTKVMKCHESKYAVCQDKCCKVCDQNHTCQKKCHYPSSCNCDVAMTKTISKCGHTQQIPCHKDPDSVNCQTLVMKRLTSCQHEMKMKCSADPSSHEFKACCDVLVPKKIPRCHHTQIMKCCKLPSMYRCKESVEKSHPRCGHSIQVMCCATPDNYTECETIVSKLLPCGHEREMKCSESYTMSFPDRYDCEKDVDYELPKCGHMVRIPCHVKTSLNQNPTPKSRRLHQSQPSLPLCKFLVTKTFVCGHETTIECSMSAQQRCSSYCSKTMSCGHSCNRKCTQCFERLTHGECKEPCKKRQICGHDCTSPTCGSCKLCSKKCGKYCPHRRCDHPCFRECIPCKKKCPLQCPHHTCSRLCHEECDRPRCDQPCPQLLKCKHPCLGYCGDPCPSLCLVCEPESWSEFNDEFNCNGDIRIVRLEDCGHEHSARKLDKSFAVKDNVLGLFCCPKCLSIIKWHPRYTNRLKKQWDHLGVMKRILALGLKDSGWDRLFPVISGGVEEIRLYVQRFNTHLFLQRELETRLVPLKESYSWSRSTTDQLTKILNNLGKSASIKKQDVSCINEILRKLSASWQLYIANTLDKDISSSDSDSEDVIWVDPEKDLDIFDNIAVDEVQQEIKSKGTEKERQTIKETGMIATLRAVDDIIRKSDSFSQTQLCKVRKKLGEVLTDLSEVDHVMDFPKLQTIGVHTDDWTICSSDHIGSTVFRGESCEQCTSGMPLTVTYATFLENWRRQFEQNLDNNTRGSKKSRRNNKRGGSGFERGGRALETGRRGIDGVGEGSEADSRGSGRGGRGSKYLTHGTNRGKTVEDQDKREMLSGPIYMASPHQSNFLQRGRGRAGRGQERGGFGGHRGGRGASRGSFDSRGLRFDLGFGRGSTDRFRMDNKRDDRESEGAVGGESTVGFRREGRGRRGNGMLNRRVEESEIIFGFRGGFGRNRKDKRDDEESEDAVGDENTVDTELKAEEEVAIAMIDKMSGKSKIGTVASAANFRDEGGNGGGGFRGRGRGDRGGRSTGRRKGRW